MERRETQTMLVKPFTIAVILVGLTLGGFVSVLALRWSPGSTVNTLLLSLGSAIISTALISIVLDLFWSREKAKQEQEQLQPFLQEFQEFTKQLEKLEGRLEAFKQLGLNYCHGSRTEALERFLIYAQESVSANPGGTRREGSSFSGAATVNIVSSSARGLVGYLDREPYEVQKLWRDLITEHPHNFRILLTHPAYAHLRQPAEERSSGDIELEVLKTAIYLHCVAGMGGEELRFYRGSPTVFAVQANKHILLNPYPYGKMAMDTLCLEFESEHEGSFVAGFMHMHFNHTWAFISQRSKLVDGRPLVEGVTDFQKIIDAFSECTYLGDPKRLRLTVAQIQELDTFMSETLKGATFVNSVSSKTPFFDYVSSNRLSCGDSIVDKNVEKAMGGAA